MGFYCHPSPFGLDFGTLGLGTWDLGLGLDNRMFKVQKSCNSVIKITSFALVSPLSSHKNDLNGPK